MQHDNDPRSRYHATRHTLDDPAPEPTRPVVKASGTLGTLLAWVLLGLVGVLIASGLLALIVTLWRVIL